eukprot:5938505-Heterocapsa_arctica.AAC.1
MHRREPRGGSAAPLDENVAKKTRRRRIGVTSMSFGFIQEVGATACPCAELVHTSGNGFRARGG